MRRLHTYSRLDYYDRISIYYSRLVETKVLDYVCTYSYDTVQSCTYPGK